MYRKPMIASADPAARNWRRRRTSAGSAWLTSRPAESQRSVRPLRGPGRGAFTGTSAPAIGSVPDGLEPPNDRGTSPPDQPPVSDSREVIRAGQGSGPWVMTMAQSTARVMFC